MLLLYLSGLLNLHMYKRSASILLNLSLLLSLFILINLAALFFNFQLFQLANEKLHRLSSKNYSYNGKDYPSQLPLRVESVAQITEESDHYGVHDSEDWLSLFPPNHGYVAFGPNNRLFAISMYHQLHCLNTLRIASIRNNSDFGHIAHCLDYLRQAILCQADTTLEESEVDIRPDGMLDSGATGLGVVHVCRDWTQVRQFVETNYEGRTKGRNT